MAKLNKKKSLKLSLSVELRYTCRLYTGIYNGSPAVACHDCKYPLRSIAHVFSITYHGNCELELLPGAYFLVGSSSHCRVDNILSSRTYKKLNFIRNELNYDRALKTLLRGLEGLF